MHIIKYYISALLGKFGYEIQRRSSESQSVKEPFYHFRDLVKVTEPVIFDVGAYIGNTVEQFRSSFPESWIHAFEPFDESFTIMKNRFQKMDRVFFNNVAIGNSVAESDSFYVTKNEGSSSLLKPRRGANRFWKDTPLLIQKKVRVRLKTIDKYCEERNINKIDILKLDVQGSEIKVLNGASRMLSEKNIKLIFTEISIASSYKDQSEIDEIISLLRAYEYRIFNFFKMKHLKGKLIECDVLFYAE